MARPSLPPLPPGHIRLLTLHPNANKAAPVHCSILSTGSISDHVFEAVSYEWGKGDETMDLHLPNGVIKINETLHDLLRALRPTRRTRTLWIDRICINQDDATEVKENLKMMDVVYGRAQRTLSWLGCSTSLTQKATEVLHSLALLACQHRTSGRMLDFDFRPWIISKRPQRSSVFPATCSETMIEGPRTANPCLIVLERRAQLSDDQIFCFDDQELWHEIDGTFGNPYFRRTWIEREVAKADRVLVYRGAYSFPWPILRWAFVGRGILQFHKFFDDSFMSLSNVIDARERWRSLELSTTLAGALVTLCHSEESRPHDRIRAASTLVKKKIEGFGLDQGDPPIEELMRKVACASIQERQNLYHLGLWCVSSRKTMALPSWAPDYKSGCCELAVQSASRKTSLLINGSYVIDHDRLILNAHLLDTIEWSHPIEGGGDLENILPIIRHLDAKFRKMRPHGLFGEYVALREGWMHSPPAEHAREEVMEQLSQADSILRSSRNYPAILLENLWHSQQKHHAKAYPAPYYNLTTIEALWSLLNPDINVPERARDKHGEQLFLAWLYLASMLQERGKGSVSTSLPKSYGNLLASVVPALSNAEIATGLIDFLWQHLRKSSISLCEPECVFVTKKGYVGRTVAGEAKTGRIVAVLQGGFTPFLLTRDAGSYRIASFAYVEGLQDAAIIPRGLTIKTICLK